MLYITLTQASKLHAAKNILDDTITLYGKVHANPT